MKFAVSYTLKDGHKVENQIYTVDCIENLLKDLIRWGASNITVQSIDR